ncbi:MAG: leucine-rich repeat domain-containing protein [Holosporales bacterium]|jgi:hypothetical protein|nr:leucine-rich repeat domain-containing protein [Holosporales bacterium]
MKGDIMKKINKLLVAIIIAISQPGTCATAPGSGCGDGTVAEDERLVNAPNRDSLSGFASGALATAQGNGILDLPALPATSELWALESFGPDDLQRWRHLFVHTPYFSFAYIVDLSRCASLKCIEKCAFADCLVLKEIRFPACLEQIGEGAFVRCERLKGIDLRHCEHLKCIEKFAFAQCRGLEEISLPACLEQIGDFAFAYCNRLSCDQLNGIIDLSHCERLKDIGGGAFSNCLSLEEIILPACLEQIGECAFACCNRLKGIDLSRCERLKDIEKCAFACCPVLEEIRLPACLEQIRGSAFYCCPNLKRIDLSHYGHLKAIGGWAFGRCRGLEEIRLPACLEQIRDSTFKHCPNLKGIDLSHCASLQCIEDEEEK